MDGSPKGPTFHKALSQIPVGSFPGAKSQSLADIGKELCLKSTYISGHRIFFGRKKEILTSQAPKANFFRCHPVKPIPCCDSG